MARKSDNKSTHGKSTNGPKRGGNRSKTSADMVDAALRQVEALRLRQAGATFTQIAATLGYSDRSGARNAVMAALVEHVHEPNNEMRALELHRLDALQLAHWQKALAGDCYATDRVLKVMERRAKILGLDARIVVDLTVDDRKRQLFENAVSALAAET